MKTNHKKLGSVLLAASLLALSGCKVGEDYKTPQLDVPSNWLFSDNEPEKKLPADEWWKNFSDPVLEELIEKARAQNLDLADAKARVKEARALANGADANLLPEVDVGASSNRGSRNGNGNNSRTYNVGFDASWEADIFGGNRRAAEAADYDVEAAKADEDDVTLTLVSEVTRNYLEYRLAQAQLDLAKQSLDSQGRTVNITEARYKEGVEGQLELSRARSQLNTTKAQVPVYENAVGAAQYRIEFLLGQNPGTLKGKLAEKKDIPVIDGLVATDTPLAVISRRPDVRVAERQLASSTALTGAAISDMYPKLTLSAVLGLESSSAGHLFRASSKVWSVGGDILMPLIDFGRVQSNIDASKARQEEAFINYKRVVQAALQDVETSMLAYAKESERNESLADAAKDSHRAVEISQAQYKEGIISQLDVLTAQQTMYDADQALATSSAAVSEDLVALYKALGYGLPKTGSE